MEQNLKNLYEAITNHQLAYIHLENAVELSKKLPAETAAESMRLRGLIEESAKTARRKHRLAIELANKNDDSPQGEQSEGRSKK